MFCTWLCMKDLDICYITLANATGSIHAQSFHDTQCFLACIVSAVVSYIHDVYLFYVCIYAHLIHGELTCACAYCAQVVHVVFNDSKRPPFRPSLPAYYCIFGPHFLIMACFSHVSLFVTVFSTSICRFPCFFTFHYYLIWTDPEWPILAQSLSCKPWRRFQIDIHTPLQSLHFKCSYRDPSLYGWP